MTGDSGARNDFWSIEGSYIYRHHVEPRVQLHVPNEETFPIPLKYIDVTSATYTNLDVLQEKRTDDFGMWTKFIRFLERIHKSSL